jgi:hypothetical protein
VFRALAVFRCHSNYGISGQTLLPGGGLSRRVEIANFADSLRNPLRWALFAEWFALCVIWIFYFGVRFGDWLNFEI